MEFCCQVWAGAHVLAGFVRKAISDLKSVCKHAYTTIVNFQMNIAYRRGIKNRKKLGR